MPITFPEIKQNPEIKSIVVKLSKCMLRLQRKRDIEMIIVYKRKRVLV